MVVASVAPQCGLAGPAAGSGSRRPVGDLSSAESGRIPSPGGWVVPPGVRPAWNWTPPPGIVPRPDRAPRWVRWWYGTPVIDRYAYSWMWSRPLRRRRAVVTWREYASRAGLERHRGPELRRCRRDLTRRLAPHLQPLICEPALVVRLPGAGLVAPSPARPSLVVLVRMPCLGPRSEQAPDLAGSEADQLLGSAVMRHRCPGKLSTGAGAPFERR
jgi:hypothetical protein